jgi:glycine/D-amino acid oxidase-like deaminating enzyme
MVDLIVIGAGLSGLMAAYTAAKAGLSVRVAAKGLGSSTGAQARLTCWVIRRRRMGGGETAVRNHPNIPANTIPNIPTPDRR